MTIVAFTSKRERMISELTKAKEAAAKLHLIAESLAEVVRNKHLRMDASNHAAMLQGLLSVVIKDLENGK